MEEKKAEEQKQVQFNLGQSQLEQIGYLMQTATNNYQQDNISGYFRALKMLFIQISSRLSKEEYKQLKDFEKKVYNIIVGSRKNGEKEEHTTTTHNKLMPILIQFHEKIMFFLELKGYLVPSRESKSSVFGQSGHADEE